MRNQSCEYLRLAERRGKLNKTDIKNNTLTRDDLVRCVPYWLVYSGCFAVITVGWSPAAVVIAVLSYGLRMFAITGFYHRYFSHKTFKTRRHTSELHHRA